jgi:hypothetical protein
VSSFDATIVPEEIQEPYRSSLRAVIPAWSKALGKRLISIVLFGSVARRAAREGSDIDVLVVADGFPNSLRDRRRPLLDEWEHVRAERSLAYLEWNLVAKSLEEARVHSPLYLDVVEDGIVLIDRGGFMEKVFTAMRERMRVLGSRRVFLEDGSWYWDLKPDFRFGDVVEI